MSGVLEVVTTYSVELTIDVGAKIRAHTTVTDAEVRKWAEIEGTEDLDPELLEEYAIEHTDESLYDLHEITDWGPLGGKNEIKILSAVKAMSVPPAFVALPGMDGDLS